MTFGRSFLTRIALVACVALAVTLVASAQVATGTIRGLVTHGSREWCLDGVIVVEEQNTKAKFETKTSEDGQYTVPLL